MSLSNYICVNSTQAKQQILTQHKHQGVSLLVTSDMSIKMTHGKKRVHYCATENRSSVQLILYFGKTSEFVFHD